MKKKKSLLLSLNKKKVSELNRSFQNQIIGGTAVTYGCGQQPGPTAACGNVEPTDVSCQSGYQCSMSCGN